MPVVVDTKNAPMIGIVLTSITRIKDISTPIRVIGGLGTSGTDTQENTRTYTSMGDITAKADT